jgi:hypothetical protein
MHMSRNGAEYMYTVIVTPHLLQKGVGENFDFACDITTSSELRISSRIYFSNLGIDITY